MDFGISSSIYTNKAPAFWLNFWLFCNGSIEHLSHTDDENHSFGAIVACNHIVHLGYGRMISVGSNLSLEVRTCIEKKKKILLTQFLALEGLFLWSDSFFWPWYLLRVV